MTRLAVLAVTVSLGWMCTALAGVADIYRSTAPGDLPLLAYPLIMSHDSATGELDESRDKIVAQWARTQSADLVKQLDCGARAFDYRPKLEKDKQIYAHHGGITIRVPMSDAVQRIAAWAEAHPSELVLLYLSHFEGDGCEDEVGKLLRSLRIKSIQATDSKSCASQLQSLSYDQARAMATLPSGGSLLAVFDCVEENYDSQINCYGKDFVCYDSWPANSAQVPFDNLHQHILNVTASDPTRSPSPSAPLWMTQAHWQSTAATITLGTLHRSSLILDAERSALNIWVKQVVEEEELAFVNLLELEDVCDHGVDVYDALQTVYLSGGR